MLSFYGTIGPEVFDFTFERLYAFVELGAVIINISLAILILRTGSQNPAARWFTLFLLCLSLWGFAEFLSRISKTVDQSILWGHLGPPGWIFMPVVFFTFTLIFTKRDRILMSFYTPFLLYLPGVVFLYLAWNTEFITIHDASQYRLYGYGWDVGSGKLFSVFIVWLEAYFLASLALLFRYWKNLKEPARKVQTLFIMLGLAVPLVIGSITDAIFPLLGKDFPETAVIFTTVMSIFVGYAILKYKLFFVPASFVLPSIFDTMVEATLLITPQGSIDKANAAALELLAYTEDELLNQSIEKIISPGHTWEALKERGLQPLAQGKRVRNLETKFITKHGEEIPVNFSASPIKREGEAVVGIVAVATDITQTKNLIRQLEETVAELQISKYELERKLGKITETH